MERRRSWSGAGRATAASVVAVATSDCHLAAKGERDIGNNCFLYDTLFQTVQNLAPITLQTICLVALKLAAQLTAQLCVG